MTHKDNPPPLVSLLSQLRDLARDFKQPQAKEDLLADCYRVSQAAIQLSRQQADLFQAQCFFRYQGYEEQEGQGLNMLAMTLLLCQQQKWNDTATLPMLCCALSVAMLPQDGRSQTNFRRRLSQSQQGLWLAVLIPTSRLLPVIGKALAGKALLRLNAAQRLMLLAALLAQKGNEQQKRWSDRLITLGRILPASFYPLLDALAAYPGILPAGTVLQTAQCQALVLSVCRDGLLCRRLSGDMATPHLELIETSSVLTVRPPSTWPDPQQVSSLWDSHWQTRLDELVVSPYRPASAYPISQPPAKLLVIQEMLANPLPEVELIAEHITAEGFLARQLKESASQRSRMNLRLQEVKHALLYQGCERTSHLLIQQALLNRLNQHYFPLQEALLQITRLLVTLLDALAARQGKFQPEAVMTLGYFACSGLFTHKKLKARLRLPGQGPQSYNINHLLILDASDQLQSHGVKLAQAWQQPPSLIEALRCHNSLPEQIRSKAGVQQMACLLGLALIHTRQIYFSTEPGQPDSEYQHQALQLLTLTREDVRQARITAVEQSRCYCPR
ncbi:hypothetical protein [Bowmanella dokdonensis]|uniref:HDOD domain-containing protein n=1 Tax=Bowmanella dokdonensis TaxID=751969 RepID=A0A939DLL5_9ALTE|nr:hypothetical protein [Bowmanella dokdonensis]MBN7824825.1 hypothetical protein [Bowmanella dokdonensis]